MIEILKNSIVVQLNNDIKYELPHLWIRDNCPCDECRIKQTQEKQFLINSVSVDIYPEKVIQEQDHLIVYWPDKHITKLNLQDIEALHQERFPQPKIWSEDFKPNSFNWSKFLSDDKEAQNALKKLLVSGVFILDNCSTKKNSLEKLSKRLGPIHETLFERIHNVSVTGHIYNVAHTAKALPLHNDFASYSAQPSIQALHMLANECDGGSSIILDGLSLLSDLRSECPEYFEILTKFEVPFREFDEDNETYAEEPIISLNSSGQIKSLRFSNQLMQMIDPNKKQIQDFYYAYHELCSRINNTKYQSSFRLKSGETLVLACHRVLHARHSFIPNGKRHLQDAYFVFDNAANNYVLLRQKNED